MSRTAQVVLKADNFKMKLPKQNAPCPCKSGRKWKRCCGRKRAENIIKGFQEYEEKKKAPPVKEKAPPVKEKDDASVANNDNLSEQRPVDCDQRYTDDTDGLLMRNRGQ